MEKYGWLETELRWICNNLDYNVALLDPGVFTTDKKAYNVHLKNCYQSYSYREWFSKSWKERFK